MPARRRHKKANGKGKLSKAQKSLVSTMIERKLDQRVEDKFIRDFFYSSIEGNWDATYHQVMTDITPVISQGDTVDTRTGLRLTPKFMRIAIRYVPQGYDSNLIDSESGNPVIVSQVPAKTPLEIFVVRVPRKTYDITPLNDLMQAFNTRYRSAGLWKQDVAMDVSQDLIKSFHLLDKKTLASRYNTQAVRLRDNPATGLSQARYINAPIMNFAQLQFKIPNKHMLYENTTNKDANYAYLLVTRVLDYRVDPTYTGTAAPLKLEYRRVFVYEDA